MMNTSTPQLLALFLLLFSVTLGQTNSLAPKILSNTTEILVETYEPYYLTCEGTAPLAWSYKSTEYKGEMGNESFNQANTTLPGYTYASRLELTDYDYQGYYYCHYNQTLDLTDENSFDDVYVYLFAYEENLVHTHQNINIKANESEEVILDCTPTKPELIVRVSFNGKVLHDGVLDEPRVGYKIPNITLGNKGVYTCAVNDDAINYTVEVSSRPSAPEVKMTSNYYPVLGYDMEITCIIIRRNSDPVFEWILPNPERIYEERVEEYRPNDMLYYQGFLKLKNATMMDSGNYTCKVQFPGYLTTQNTIDIQVQETKNSCIDVFPSDNGIVTCDEGANGTWLMTVDHFPPTLLHEFSHFFEGKVDGEKYTMQLFQNGTCLLEMLGVRITDTGKYILNLTTLDGVASFLVELELRVRGKPRLNLTGVEDILEAYKVIEAKCIETGYPLEDIHWSYHSCSEGVCEEDSQILNGSLDVEVNSRSKEYMQVSTTVFNVTELAKLRCQAGNASVEIPIRILDIEKPYVFKYTLDNDSKEIPSTAEHNFVETDFINLYCGASKYDYSNLTIDPPIANKDSKGRSINIIDDSTKYSFIKKIVLENATKDLSGKYECNALYRNSSSIQTNTLTLNITDLHPVHFSLESNMKTRDYTIPKIAKESFKFLCLVHGTKPISIIWTKDGQPLPKNFTFADETNQIIEINDLSSDIHDGRYACTASNRKGKYHVTGFLTLVVSGERYSASTKVILSIVLAGIGFLLLVVFVLCRRVRRDVLRRRIERKNAAYLFERGRPNELNPDCSADEQAELLPYDKKCEVSRDRITFGQQLGSGAFGRVIKAMVSNVEPGKESTIVAVKMCKSQADISQVRALTLELKIMLHIGKHLNIVNLLGANTARIDKGELWILVEYCRYGSLLWFLHRQRKSFISIIDPVSGFINYSSDRGNSICPLSPIFPKSPFSPNSLSSFSGEFGTISTEMSKVEELENSKLFSGENTVSSGIDEEEIRGKWSSSAQRFSIGSPKKGRNMVENLYYQKLPTTMHQETSQGSDTTNISDKRLSRKYSQGSHIMYDKSTIPGVTSSFTTVDLICWAWQVAEGMDYLAHRKVLHGDLAARNLLLAEDNVVKISDFGLSRDIYKKDIYVKKADDVMPVKWLSTEAIRDRIFGVESDIWAFGVTMWELFTLGGSPYPGIPVDETFLLKLEKGYRMEKPRCANDEIYQLILNCWKPEPEERPGFRSLAGSLSHLLLPETTQHYNDRNECYMNINEERFKKEPDYLEMLPVPDFKSLYKKDPLNSEKDPGPSYLPMLSFKGSHTPQLEDSFETPIFDEKLEVFLSDNSTAKNKEDIVRDVYRQSRVASDGGTIRTPSLLTQENLDQIRTEVPKEGDKEYSRNDNLASPLKNNPLKLTEKVGMYANLQSLVSDSAMESTFDADKMCLVSGSKEANYANLPKVC